MTTLSCSALLCKAASLLASDPFGGVAVVVVRGMHSASPPQPSVAQSLMDSPYGGVGEAGPAGPLEALTAAPPALYPCVHS